MPFLLTLAALLSACGRYADFGLPAQPGPKPPVTIRWEALRQPVMTRGPEAFDSVDVLNPSIVQQGGKLWNLYSAFDGRTWHTALATSVDGLAWTKLGRVLSPAGWEGDYIAANGSAVYDRDEFFYWYQAGDPPQIGMARSKDGRSWTRHGAPVLATGPRGSWDERGVADPYVIREGEWLYMVFLGQDRAKRQRLGLARSVDGSTWEKSRSNPILDLDGPGAFDENGLGEPALWKAYGRWWLLYTGRDRAEVRRIGMAESEDGVEWRRFTGAAVFAGKEPWNREVVCDPSVIATGDAVRVWFGGGDVPHPAERIHGQIGYATLHMEVR